MNGGYFMVDCGGLNLLSESAQTITGIYNRVKTAIATGKPVFANNIVWGTGNPVTPVPVLCNFESTDSTTIICTAATLQIVIASNDSITIVNLAPSANAKRK